MSKNEDDNVVVKDPSSRLSSSPKHIYEVFLEYVNTGNKDKPVEPKVLQTFPKDYDWDEDTKKNFPKFCFPCKPFILEKQQCFTFTLTDIDGNYRFGFCYFPKESNCTKCYCFFSYLPWFEFFYWALERINEFKKDLSEVHKVEPFLSALYDHSIPEVNNMDQQAPMIAILPQGSLSHSYKFPLPHPHKTPSLPTDHNLHLMYTNLSHEVIIAIFASAIYERRIIMHSKDLSLLSACIHATDALLYPLHWQHIFCPIMPPSLMDYCCAPMPFLMGVHESIMKDVERMPIDDVVIVDLDENQLESPYLSMDLEGFPASLLHGLEKVLKKTSNTQGDAVAKAFMDALVAIIGGYQSALKLRPGDKEITFDRDLFIKSRANMAQLLENLLHFQHFQQFINGRIQRKKGAFGMNRDRFDEAVSFWEDNPPKSTKIEAESLKEGIISAVKLTKKGLSKGSGLLQKKGEQVFNRIQDRMKQDYYKSDLNFHKRSLERSSTTQVPTARQFENDMFRDPETVRQLVQLRQAHMNKTPPPVPKSYQKHKLERASLVELEIERSTEIPKSVSNNSLPNVCVSTTTSNEPPTANLLSFSPPPTPPPRRRKQRGAKEIAKENAPPDVPDRSGTTLDNQSSSDEVDTSSSSSSTSTSPIDNMVPPPLPPRDEIDYVDLLQPKVTTSYVDLPLSSVPPPLPPRDEPPDSPVLMYNSSSAPPLPPRDEPSAPLLPPRSDIVCPTVPPRDKKRLSPNTTRKITSYTPPLQHKDIDLGPRRNSIDTLTNSKLPDVSLLEIENEWESEDFGNTLARQLLQSSRSSFSEEIAKRLQSNSIMRPSKAVMDTLSSDDPFSSSLPPPLIPSSSTSSSPQVNRKTDDCASTTGSNNPLDWLLDKSDLSKWVTTSSSNQQQENNTTTANGNVLT